MKRWVAMLLILVFTLSGCGLMGGIGETDPAANPVEGNTGTDADYLSLTAELEQARQVKLELGSEAQAALPDFAAAVELLRDQGLEFLSYGMPRQASWYLSFAGGSVSAVRYAAELLLGESSTGFSGWDTIGAISLCSPVPFLCEAVTAEKSGDTDRAAQCRELAARNPDTANGFDEFSALASLSDSGDPLKVSVSIGIAVIKDDYNTQVEYLIGKADDAMYSVKKSGKSNFAFI